MRLNSIKDTYDICGLLETEVVARKIEDTERKGDVMRKAIHNGLFRRGCAVGLGGALLVFSAVTAPAMTWYNWSNNATRGTDVDGVIYTLSGDSLDNLFFAYDGGTRLMKFDSEELRWDPLASWDTHRETNWDQEGETPDVASDMVVVSGNHIYVSSRDSFSYIGYSSDAGQTWTDIDTGSSQATRGLVADGSKALFAGSSGSLRRVLDGDSDGNTTVLSGTLSALGGSGSNYWVLGPQSSSVGGNLVSYSTDGGYDWTQTVEPVTPQGVPSDGAVHVLGPDSAIIANAARVHLTTDSGDSWLTYTQTVNMRSVFVEEWDTINDVYSVWAMGNSARLVHYTGGDWDVSDNWETVTLPVGPEGSQTLRKMTKVDGYYFVTGPDGVMYTTIPEPSTIMLLGSAAGLWFLRRRRRIKPGHQVQ